MLWYSFLGKRGGYIKKMINWYLYNNEKQIINNENVLCEYEDNRLIYYKENNFINRINLEENVYIREGNDYKVIYDFKKQEMILLLKENNMQFSSKFTGIITKNNNIINVIYNNDDGNKKIIIQLL